MNDDLYTEIFEAPVDFLAGKPNRLDSLIRLMHLGGTIDDRPIIFFMLENLDVIKYLDKNNVDFFILDEFIGGHTTLHQSIDSDQNVFQWMVNKYKKNGKIDIKNEDGITALSAAIKFGNLEYAQILLEAGADPKSSDLQGLSVAKQAIYCIEGEDIGISGLKLLIKHGLTFSKEYKEELIQNAQFLSQHKMEKYLLSL
jgi:Ankyrin repeats (3 copies)